ncbi:MAG: cell division FtsA domain-containing protein [bacterium]|nr:cell division FtsA domain-containing protein [bacterium]
MENLQHIVAIEIGSTKIVGAIAEKSTTGYLSVNHLEEEKLTNCVRYGCVQNVENTKNAIVRIVKKLENKVDGDITDIYVGFNGRSLHSVPTEIDRNLNISESITKQNIENLKQSAFKEPIASFEPIDIVAQTYYVDNKENPNPVGCCGGSINIKFNRIVAKPTLQLNLRRAIGDYKVKKLMVTSLAMADSILTEEERMLGCMLVDMGAETTTVSIFKAGTLVYFTTLPFGGRNLTRDLVNGLQNTTEEKAEMVKKAIAEPLNLNAESITINDVNSKSAINYIISRTSEMITNVNKQIEYAHLQSADVKTIVLVGGGAKLKGLQAEFKEKTKIETRMGTTPPGVNILNHEINKFEYIQVFSLLNKAAEMIADGATCVRRHFYEPADGPTITTEQQAEEQPKKEEKQKKKRSFFGQIRDKFDELLTEEGRDD